MAGRFWNKKTGGNDSKKESERAIELKLLERAGKIQDLQQQVWIELQEGFTTKSGEKIQPIHYVADFVYWQDGIEVVEDVKAKNSKHSTITEDFKIKIKLLKKRYPDIRFYLNIYKMRG